MDLPTWADQENRTIALKKPILIWKSIAYFGLNHIQIEMEKPKLNLIWMEMVFLNLLRSIRVSNSRWSSAPPPETGCEILSPSSVSFTTPTHFYGLVVLLCLGFAAERAFCFANEIEKDVFPPRRRRARRRPDSSRSHRTLRASALIFHSARACAPVTPSSKRHRW